MMNPQHWAKDTRVRLLNPAAFAFLFPVLLLGGPSDQISRAARANAAPGLLALLKAGITEQAQKQPAAAVRDLRAVREKELRLADYVAYSLGAAECDLGDFNGALTDLQPVFTNVPPSPLSGDAAMLAARAYKPSASRLRAFGSSATTTRDLHNRPATRCWPLVTVPRRTWPRRQRTISACTTSFP